MKIFAVDFDGTIVSSNFPYIGEPKEEVVDILRKLMENPDNKFILWSCRHGKYLEQAIEMCDFLGLRFDAINDDIPEIIEMWKDDRSKKVTADYYIDDHSTELQNLKNLLELLE